MKTFMFKTLKELTDRGRRFFGEDMSDPRNAEISNALYAAIGLKHFIELGQFSNKPSLQSEVRKISGAIQSILNQYKDSEAKDISTNDLTMLLEEIKKLPSISVIRENTTEPAIMSLNLVAESINRLHKAIHVLQAKNIKGNSRPSNLTPGPH